MSRIGHEKASFSERWNIGESGERLRAKGNVRNGHRRKVAERAAPEPGDIVWGKVDEVPGKVQEDDMVGIVDETATSKELLMTDVLQELGRLVARGWDDEAIASRDATGEPMGFAVIGDGAKEG